MLRILRSRFVKDSAVYAAGALAAGVFNYLFHIVAAHKLPVAAYGELQTLIALFTIFGVFIVAINYFFVRHVSVFAKAEDAEAVTDFTKETRREIIKWSALLLIVFLVLTPLLYTLLKLSSFEGLILTLVAVFFSILSAVGIGVLNGWGKFFASNAVTALGTAVKFLGALLFIGSAKTVTAGSWAILVSALASWGLAELGFLRIFKSNHKIASSRPLVSENGTRNYQNYQNISNQQGWKQKYFADDDTKHTLLPIFSFALLGVLLANIDVLIVKNVTTAEITGYYGALKMLGTVAYTINMAIIAVMLPEVFSTGHQQKPLNPHTRASAYGLIGTISLAITAVYYLFPSLILRILFGSRYLLVSEDVWLFGLMSFMLSLLLLEATLAFARRKYSILYLLMGVAVLMGTGIGLFHNSIREIAIVMSLVFGVGYVSVKYTNMRY